MVPSIIFVFPMFLVMADLRLTDTLLSLILGYVCITLPFSMWLMWAFFRSVPIEIEEAALVDGASRLRVFPGNRAADRVARHHRRGHLHSDRILERLPVSGGSS
jgi:4-amino-4-deoxy-L-arabinose transferase-like glycosyltransferase